MNLQSYCEQQLAECGDFEVFPRHCQAILDALEEQGPLTRREIEYECHLTKSAALNRLETLQDAGLIDRRRSDEDARRFVYFLSD